MESLLFSLLFCLCSCPVHNVCLFHWHCINVHYFVSLSLSFSPSIPINPQNPHDPRMYKDAGACSRTNTSLKISQVWLRKIKSSHTEQQSTATYLHPALRDSKRPGGIPQELIQRYLWLCCTCCALVSWESSACGLRINHPHMSAGITKWNRAVQLHINTCAQLHKHKHLARTQFQCEKVSRSSCAFASYLRSNRALIQVLELLKWLKKKNFFYM